MRTSDFTKLSLEYHGTHEYRRGGDQIDLQPHLSNVAEQTDHNIHAADLSFDLWDENLVNRFNAFASMQIDRSRIKSGKTVVNTSGDGMKL